MAITAGTYSMQCWNSTRNPEQVDRPRLLHQCLQLVRTLQKKLSSNEIVLPSRDEKDSLKGIEICIMFPAGARLFDDIAQFLTATAKDLALDFQTFRKQDLGITRYFNDEQAKRLSQLDVEVPELSEDQLREFGEDVQQRMKSSENQQWRDSIPAAQENTSFTISRDKLHRLSTMEGDELRDEIKAIMEQMKVAKETGKSAWEVIMLIADGILFLVGSKVLQANASNIAMGLMLIASYVGPGVAILSFAAILAVGGALLGGLYLTFKGSKNVLLVVNDTKSDLLPLADCIRNGERTTVPTIIPASDPNIDCVNVAFFIYDKWQAKGYHFGSYGSNFGVTLASASQGVFSIGMDCPNSLAGGNNSIEVCTGNRPGKVQDMAESSGCIHGWIDAPRVDVKIADHWGDINWGRAVIMGD